MIIGKTTKRLTLLQVYYYIPDYTSLLNEFTWQYYDHHPKFPRTHKFLNHWHDNIDAVIAEILMSHSGIDGTTRSVTEIFKV